MPAFRFPVSLSASRASLLATAIVCMGGGLSAVHAQGLSELAQAELNRRAANAAEAQELLLKGDEAYEAARYDEAAQAYRGAIDLLPENAPAVAAQRQAALQRYSQASVERARELRRFGDLEGANAALDAVLDDKVAPNDSAALAMREQLLDPIRTNPASSKEHTANIEEVRLLLYKADGAYELGKFDEAHAVYEDVLQVDPYNTAARRGMERVAAARGDYYRAAYDHTRAEMLSMVDAEWELQVPAPDEVRSGPISQGGGAVVDYIDKLESIVLPVVALEDVTLAEAVEFARQQSIALDTFELDPSKRGINLVVDVGGPDSDIGKTIRGITFSLNLRNVKLGQLLDYIAEATRTVVKKQPFAVVFAPAGADSTDMVVRTYRVPPDFLTSGAVDGDDAMAVNDPFAPKPEGGAGLLAKRLTAEEKLKSRGVPFPEGASATFNSGSSTLRVLNTAVNQSMVEQIVEAISSEEPTSVIVEVKIIKTQERTLKEISFDWVLGNFGLGGSGGVPGTAAGYLGGGTTGNGAPITDVNGGTGSLFSNPVTAGNRSGSYAITGDSIDDAINNRSGGIRARAPGTLWVNGFFNDAYVSMLMRGLDQKKGTDLAAVPSVTTRSGQQASVRVTREFIYPTEYEPPELPNQVGGGGFIDLNTGETFQEEIGLVPVTPATPTDFEMREVGVILDVLPTASKDKRYVDVNLKPSVVDFDGFINYGTPILAGQSFQLNPFGGGQGLAGLFTQTPQVITPNEILMPVFSKMGTETALTVADGATIVIGGLLEERSQTVNDKTPILGDIPVVGRLFQSNASAPVKTAIIFLVKVRVVDAAGRPFNP